MPELTRAEALERAQLLDVERYVVDLDLTRGEEVFGSTTVVRFTVRGDAATDTRGAERYAGAEGTARTEGGPGEKAAGSGGLVDTFAQLRPAALACAELDGVRLPPEAFAEGRLALRGMAAGRHELRVVADMPYSRVGEGMHRFTDPADGRSYVYTQCCMADAPLVYACFDQPDLKAEFEVSVSAPEDWTVLGNGVARRVGAGRWECARTPPISTYLLAVVAGPYHSVWAEHAGLPFGLHVRRSLAEFLDAEAEELFEVSFRCFDRYHEVFRERYPFDSYDQAFVPEFNAGAMENPGLVTFRDEFVFRAAVTETERQTRGMVIAHEMAHMWFGDLVTLRWWDDIWLNESFAEYMGYQTLAEATRFTRTWTDFAGARKAWGYAADQRGSTHPVAPASEEVPDTAAARLNFDGISYAKGASALRQLVAWLGAEAFFAGINEHFARHRFGNASLADFLDSLAAVSERDVHGWAERWLRTTGVDTVRPCAAVGSGGGWSVSVRHEGCRPHRLAVGVYDLAGERAEGGAAGGGRALVLRERLELELAADERESAVSSAGPVPDLLLANDGDLTYAKVRLDEVSWRTVCAALSGLPDALSRAVVWNAVREMVRDGELAPWACLEVVRAHAAAEVETSVAGDVLTFARRQVADRFLPAVRRTEALELLAGACRELLWRARWDGGAEGASGGSGAGAGSVSSGGSGAGVDRAGLRLTAVRQLIDCALEPDELQGWWAAGKVPEGPVLDAELRWRLLLRLSVLGAVGGAEIDAALAADPSAAGEEGAARCRAALPDAAGKAAAWEAMFGDVPESAALSNHVLTATAQGFWQPEQGGLLAEYAGRFFEEAVALAERRGPAVAAIVGRYGFPHTVVSAEVLRRGEECLRGADGVVPAALRRQLADHLDDLRRALAVRGSA